MLGCQDFCGYYDWTFHYLRREFGPEAVARFWAKAIGGEAQQHYAEAARTAGLRGLLSTWCKTGEEEHCDWTFTLDEPRNVLRWDMRQCPSKGFLLEHGRQADEDYCDHCMGWIIPLLDHAGVRVLAHEHNHCGQCWGEMGMADKGSEPLTPVSDIRRDPRWNRGYLDRWANRSRLPLTEEVSLSADPCDVLAAWFRRADRLLVLGRGPSSEESWVKNLPHDCVLTTDSRYVRTEAAAGEPLGVLIGDGPRDLGRIAARYGAAPTKRRPLLMHAYLPGAEIVDFVSAGLPRPIPLLPLLIRKRLYSHEPGRSYPTTGVFLVLLGAALGKPVNVAGIDLYEHPSGQVYAGEDLSATDFSLPPRHSRECDVEHLRRAVRMPGASVTMTEPLRSRVCGRTEGNVVAHSGDAT